jgi:hypothetical protein
MTRADLYMLRQDLYRLASQLKADGAPRATQSAVEDAHKGIGWMEARLERERRTA